MSTDTKPTAVSAREIGVYWAAGIAEFVVTMDDDSEWLESVRIADVPLAESVAKAAMAKAERDAQQEESQ